MRDGMFSHCGENSLWRRGEQLLYYRGISKWTQGSVKRRQKLKKNRNKAKDKIESGSR